MSWSANCDVLIFFVHVKQWPKGIISRENGDIPGVFCETNTNSIYQKQQ